VLQTLFAKRSNRAGGRHPDRAAADSRHRHDGGFEFWVQDTGAAIRRSSTP
jgi:hypothetical protein